jgi:hypothetical protein
MPKKIGLGELPLCGASGFLPARLSFFCSKIKDCFDKEGNNEYGLLQVL